VKVQALDANGTVLGESALIAPKDEHSVRL